MDMERYFVIRRHSDGKFTGGFEDNVLIEEKNIIKRRYIVLERHSEFVEDFFSSYLDGHIEIDEVIDKLDETFKQK